MKRFLKEGLKAIFRGKFMSQPPLAEDIAPSTHKDERILDAGATLLESIYDAIEAQPDNKHCILVKQQNGISNALDFSKDIPIFESVWLKHETNQRQQKCWARAEFWCTADEGVKSSCNFELGPESFATLHEHQEQPESCRRASFLRTSFQYAGKPRGCESGRKHRYESNCLPIDSRA